MGSFLDGLKFDQVFRQGGAKKSKKPDEEFRRNTSVVGGTQSGNKAEKTKEI